MSHFTQLLNSEFVTSYLEIGSKFGGSLWRIGKSLPKGSKIVSVDLPHGDTSFKENLPHLQDCVLKLNEDGYNAHLIIGDSTDPKIIEQVKALGPFDACFIDANHTLPYVTKDFENYGSLARIVAFHDIGFFRKEGLPPHKKPIEVPVFWKSIKQKFKNVEIRYDKQDNGIGVLWR